MFHGVQIPTPQGDFGQASARFGGKGQTLCTLCEREMMSTGTEGKTPPSPAEQARLRRERREKKILAQGTSRLEKIAGLQGGATAREALSSHADPPEHDISGDNILSAPENSQSPPRSTTSPDSTRRPSRAVSPGRNVFSVDGGDEDPFNMLGRGNDPMANVPEELRNDPMMKLLLKNPLLEHLAGSGVAERDAPSRDSSSDDLNRLAERLNQQLFGPSSKSALSSSVMPSGSGIGAEESVALDTSIWKWKLVRIIAVVSVLYYLWIQLDDIHFSRTLGISLGIVSLCLDGFGLIVAYLLHLHCFLAFIAGSSSRSRKGSAAPWIDYCHHRIFPPPSLWNGISQYCSVPGYCHGCSGRFLCFVVWDGINVLAQNSLVRPSPPLVPDFPPPPIAVSPHNNTLKCHYVLSNTFN